ncbi:Gfo/Idh/MocA family protein [Leifsonia sp. NPDC058194]|uniref:Gfo/Idh/MocA family protein n=1 Tax=Leifsonia sp. NPDC058194 TaxID=3346374 RepID=UPI0036DA6C60
MAVTNGPIRVGVIGAGAISASYLENLKSFPDVDVVIVGDLDTDRSAARAQEFEVPKSGTATDVIDNDAVEIVVNLTIPAAHAEVSAAALEAGKNVWSEKPVGVTRSEGAALVRLASEKGLRLGVAPDTLLGPGMQTVRRIIESGAIGVPLSAQTLFQTPGPQLGHPNPEFLFQPGAGPLFDFGPYYFTALANIFGSFSRIAAHGAKSTDTRVVGSGPLAGTEFAVNVPTHVATLAQFEGGGVAQSVLSFDTQLQRMGFFEIYGSEATLSIPDPNRFTGRIRLAHAPDPANRSLDHEIVWEDIEPEGALTARGLGVLDLGRAIREERPHVATGELGTHVLDALVSAEESIERGEFVDIATSIDPVPLLPVGFDPFARTL